MRTGRTRHVEDGEATFHVVGDDAVYSWSMVSRRVRKIMFGESKPAWTYAVESTDSLTLDGGVLLVGGWVMRALDTR